jgi:Fungal chitosanase of glycosyl hydrolase group 75
MKRSTIDIIQSVPINLILSDAGDELVIFRADADIDCDGSGGNPDGDKYFQPDTTLHRDGFALNAYDEAFVVVPPVVCKKTKGKVLGALCLVENTLTLQMCFAVVGDIGPTFKVGELSPAAAKQIGVNPNPVTGGESRNIIRYTIFVGVPAVVGAFKYQLQSYGK